MVRGDGANGAHGARRCCEWCAEIVRMVRGDGANGARKMLYLTPSVAHFQQQESMFLMLGSGEKVKVSPTLLGFRL
jgi:hypothetical protein